MDEVCGGLGGGMAGVFGNSEGRRRGNVKDGERVDRGWTRREL